MTDKLHTEVSTFTFDLKRQIVKLDPTPVGTGAQAAAIPLHCQNRPFDLTHAGQRPPSANLDDFPPHVPHLDDGTTGLDCNDAMDGATADEREGSRRTITHPHRKDADNRLYSTVARQCQRRTRRVWWSFHVTSRMSVWTTLW